MMFLKKEQYYIDRYDLQTIEECLQVIESWQKVFRNHFNDKEIKDLPREEKIKGFNYYLNWELRGIQGERYRHKNERIEEMVERDRKTQDFYDNTSPPPNVICNSCNKLLYSDTKILEDFMDKPMRVLFSFPCPTCKKKRGVYNTGEEFVSKTALCPKCGHKLEEKHTVKGKDKVIIWTRNCPSCKYSEEEIDDFEKSQLKWKKKQQKDKELLEKYRSEFCLSDEKGKEYIELFDKLTVANEVFEEEKQKYDNLIYQRSIQLKKLSIVDLEKLLIEPLEKAKYIKFSLNRPEIGQYVIAPFTVQDADSSRKGPDSSKSLEKLIKTILEDTNWKLMSNTLSYRLGYVSGQLKGYEREEDMLELAGKKKEQKPSSVQSETRKKYEYDNLVQLARLIGKQEGIENVRKRRLEHEPNGFLLEASEGPYTCGICSENHYGNEIWWNLDGLRCTDCWRNIKKGVIPSLKYRYDKDSNWFQDWQIQSDYGVHPATAGKLRRQGLLRGRNLKKADGTTYYTVYLKNDNQEFLKKYPKIDSKIKTTVSGPDGKRV